MPPTETLRAGNGSSERSERTVGGSSSGGGASEQTYIIRQSNKCYEHRDSQATAMSVDYSGQWVLLAGRGHLALQRLGQDDGTLRRHERQSKYEVSVAEFAICPSRREYCAIATSQNIDIVRWGRAEPDYENSLRGHTRTVTDIDWHSKNPNLLVSCSIDTFSHIWDLRDPRKPALSLNAVCMSGATQVGFNRVSGNLLAAAHDGDLRIWDIRKGSCPTHYITAHLNRVHGINWSHRRETCLATASQDGTVKYFDVCNPRRAEKIITTLSPVWRARYTPIGNGLVSIVVPHLGRGENSLLLWSNSKQTDPICSFVGHTDVILDFAWRPNRENSTEIELVTWSRDRTLRVWKIDETMLKLCEPSAEKDEETESPRYESELSELRAITPPEFLHNLQPRPMAAASLPIAATLEAGGANTLPMARSPSFGGVYTRREETHIARSLTDQPTCSLHHEFSLLNTNMPNVDVDMLDAIKRYACFKICAADHTAILQVTFPTLYPSPNVPPDFQLCQGTTLSSEVSAVLMKVLRTNALQRVKKSRSCLEQCLRALVAAMKKRVTAVSGVSASDRSQLLLQSPRLEGALSSALHDACIPFPRTSGVHFNAIGMLTTFAQVLNTKRLTLRQHQTTTPRTLSAINSSGLLGNVMATTQRDANASFYLQERMISGKQGNKQRVMRQMNGTTPVVHVYDASQLLHINREMAREFTLDKHNIAETCRRNGEICRAHGRLDLLPIWLLAELIATPHVPQSQSAQSKRCELLFYQDPFKKSLLESLIMHYASAGDIQTAVLLACLFDKCPAALMDGVMDVTSCRLPPQLNAQLSPYHTVLPLDFKSSAQVRTVNSHWQQLKQLRSNSWSDSLDWLDFKLGQTDAYACSLIRRTKMPLFDQFKRAYADVLFGWQLLSHRALILKHTLHPAPPPQGVEFVTECSGCAKPKRTPKCEPCKRPVLFCTLCCLPVRGAANACLSCGHGGHMQHMMQWFENHNVCAKGCGCLCLQRTSDLLALVN